jgi:hypothetical protein
VILSEGVHQVYNPNSRGSAVHTLNVLLDGDRLVRKGSIVSDGWEAADVHEGISESDHLVEQRKAYGTQDKKASMTSFLHEHSSVSVTLGSRQP